MKKILITLCIIMLSFAMRAQEHMTFMGIPIDGKISTFVQKLEDKGFTYIEPTEIGCTLYGDFAGESDCIIGVYGSPTSNTVWKVSVGFPSKPSWISVKIQYLKLKEIYTEKYGKPIQTNEVFALPYRDGTGDELFAIKSGKGYYMSFFKTDVGKILIQINAGAKYGSGYIMISYEDGINVGVMEKEKESSILEDI